MSGPLTAAALTPRSQPVATPVVQPGHLPALHSQSATKRGTVAVDLDVSDISNPLLDRHRIDGGRHGPHLGR